MITGEVTSDATKVETQLKLKVQVALLKWSKADERHGLSWFALEEIGGGQLTKHRRFQTVTRRTYGADMLEARNRLICATSAQQAGDIFPFGIPVVLKMQDPRVGFSGILIALVF